MFTGIVEEKGKILTITERSIEVAADIVLDKTKIGDSICVNGVCLTVTAIKHGTFRADISPETYKVTALKTLGNGDFVNLERAMSADGRFGGHIVSGHIDGIGKIKSITKSGEFYDVSIELNNKDSKYIVKKGSISVNGVSLTVAEIDGNVLKLAIIPHTFDNTVFSYLKSGDYVNIETDIFAKYIEKFLSMRDNRTGIDMEFLLENGF